MKRAFIAILLALILAIGVSVAGRWWLDRRPNNPLTAGAGPEVVLMDFSHPFPLDSLPPGWMHRTFWTRPPMQVDFVTKEGVPALRCETNASGSIFGRWTDIDLEKFPTLSWRWFVEVPIASDVDERTRAGDDHPIRFFLQFSDSTAKTHAAEIIWANRLFQRGDWKLIDGFVHYVADGGNANIGQWRDETADLLTIYRRASGRTDIPRLKQIAIFCDSDDTKTRSIAYVGPTATLGR